MLITEKIEQTFLGLLQHNINVIFNNKSIKTGKLLLVSHKCTTICLTLQLNDNQIKTYELPYPYDFYNCNQNETNVIFDYCTKKLAPDRANIHDILSNYVTTCKKPHRFMYGKVTITVDNY